jgi:hypothetical protein
MPRHRSRTAEARAMQAGCSAVTDQFARFRAWAVQELAWCPEDGTAAARRAELVHSLDAINREIAVSWRMNTKRMADIISACRR